MLKNKKLLNDITDDELNIRLISIPKQDREDYNKFLKMFLNDSCKELTILREHIYSRESLREYIIGIQTDVCGVSTFVHLPVITVKLKPDFITLRQLRYGVASGYYLPYVKGTNDDISQTINRGLALRSDKLNIKDENVVLV